jgi:uncharacterized membrane protein YccC
LGWRNSRPRHRAFLLAQRRRRRPRLALTIATAFAYGLLTVQYALFTAAITTYAVLLADTLGEPALEAAGQRALATAIGIAIAGIAFLIWSNPRDDTDELEKRRLTSPEAAAR